MIDIQEIEKEIKRMMSTAGMTNEIISPLTVK